MDGTYYIANYLSLYKHRTPLHELVLYDGKLRFPFFAFCFGYQMFLILMTAYSGLHARRKGKAGLTLLFRLAIFGMVIFFMIWETNARYPFNFTPLLMLLATEGTFGQAEKKTLSHQNHRKKSLDIFKSALYNRMYNRKPLKDSDGNKI